MSDAETHDSAGTTQVADNDTDAPPRALPEAAKRALAEAEARRAAQAEAAADGAKEIGGAAGPDPVRYGDWEKGGIISDF
ncbi:MAG: DUF1674 domain-containing protein [Hyphomicrobiaceae bacterium]